MRTGLCLRVNLDGEVSQIPHDGVGSGDGQLVASTGVLGEADGADAGEVGYVDVSDGVTDEGAALRGLVEELEGSLDGVGVRFHEFGVPGCAADDGMDQVRQLVPVEVVLDRAGGIVADDDDGAAGAVARLEQGMRARRRIGLVHTLMLAFDADGLYCFANRVCCLQS